MRKAKYSIASHPNPSRYIERSMKDDVPNPRIPIVPVAGSPRCFGERGGRRRHDRASGCVAQTLQGQGAALYVAAPGMIGERAIRQPVPPVGRPYSSSRGSASSTVEQARRPPGQRHESLLPLVKSGTTVAASSDDPSPRLDVNRECRLTGRGSTKLLIAIAIVLPLPWNRAHTRRPENLCPGPRPGPRRIWPAAGGCRWPLKSPGARW